ncbi:MAG: glucuronate isomerase [Phycisphaerae bacterium]|jgi:glucuronate isomerase|nr:glucuronate isomerase [Phycisphaerae bacterium]
MSDLFITDDFLLQTESARSLYHQYVRDLPIIDYHCHLPPQQVAQDQRFENLTHIWLNGDHYKWRLMRAAGVDETYITGDASDWEKFEKWAAVVPQTLRNPMYHWVHLELKRPFGISDRLLCPDTARSIWDECNEKLASPEFSARGIMKRMNVVLVCTTDDPTDSLEHHQAVAADESFDIRMLPTFRPDKAMAVESPAAFNEWTDRLAAVADVDISDFASFMQALGVRHAFFGEAGCRLSDHGLASVCWAEYSDAEIGVIFEKLRSGREIDESEAVKFKSAMMFRFGVMDSQADWTQQIHYGALRNNSTRLFGQIGPDCGVDSIGQGDSAIGLSGLLDRLDSNGALGRTILYNMNPCDNEMLATMAGNFQGGYPGKMQFGSGWWFLDQLDGMTRQIDALSNTGLLSRFVGMLTDSRSFLSYTRHEYFRRMLCNILGGEMESGLLPDNPEMIGAMAADISHHNASRYFQFDLD